MSKTKTDTMTVLERLRAELALVTWMREAERSSDWWPGWEASGGAHRSTMYGSFACNATSRCIILGAPCLESEPGCPWRSYDMAIFRTARRRALTILRKKIEAAIEREEDQ